MKSVIISAFPGTGKSWVTEHYQLCRKYTNDKDGSVVELTFHDSDSSKFSWIYDENGNKTDQRNPSFPANYMEHIKALYEEENNIIFVSSHEQVRKALIEASFHFYIVRPDIALKDQYIENYRERGNDEKFINLIEKNWYIWLSDLDKFHNRYMEQVTLVEEMRGVYMDKVLDYLYEQNFPTPPYRIIVGVESVKGVFINGAKNNNFVKPKE